MQQKCCDNLLEACTLFAGALHFYQGLGTNELGDVTSTINFVKTFTQKFRFQQFDWFPTFFRFSVMNQNARIVTFCKTFH